MLVNYRFTWGLLNACHRFFYRFKFEKDLIPIETRNREMQEREQVMKQRFSDLTVKAGPFRGMRYPDFIAYGSAMYPKLAGCYESELLPSIESMISKNYQTIVDIGCAEGYYAVGFAMRCPEARVYAFDVEAGAMEACQKMAKLNNVDNRMVYGTFCSAETLMQIPYGSRSLVISDCEGYEKELFTPSVLSRLSKVDLLIELHDLYDERISHRVLSAIAETHEVELIYSENTFIRMERMGILGDYSDQQVLDFFVERNGIMRWAIAKAKSVGTN